MSSLIAPEARMGNDIARQFGHLGRDEAVAAIAAHIDQFWDPRMRRALAELVAAQDSSLDPLLVAAAADLAARSPVARPQAPRRCVNAR